MSKSLLVGWVESARPTNLVVKRRRAPVDESDYWARLEYRVCHELDGLRHTVARPNWCDGFVPSRYILSGHSPRILGRAWMGIGPRYQEQWEFTLLLGRPFGSPE